MIPKKDNTIMRSERRLRELAGGFVMATSHVYYFKFFGKYYTTNKRRKKKYSMDWGGWYKTDLNTWWMIKQIWQKNVRRVK